MSGVWTGGCGGRGALVASEVGQAEHHEDGLCGDRCLAPYIGAHRAQEELPAFPPVQSSGEQVRLAEQYRGSVGDVQITRDSRFPDEVEQEAEKVVEDCGYRAAVSDAGRSDVAIVEDVTGLDVVPVVPDVQPVTVRVGRAAPKTVRVVRREVTGRRRTDEPLGPGRSHRVRRRHAGLARLGDIREPALTSTRER